MNDYLENLRTDIWRTSGARYNAARRLRRREAVATFSVAFFSATSVAIAFAQRIYAVPATPLDNYLTALSATLGVFILTISLIEWGVKTGTVAEALHKNAEQLNGLQRKIGLTLAMTAASAQSSDVKAATEFAEKYEVIKTSCEHNHLPVDDEYFRAINRHAVEFSDDAGSPKISKVESIWVSAKWYVRSIGYFTLLWIIVAAALWGAFAARHA